MPLKLPKLQKNLPISTGDFPSTEFHIWWQRVANALTDSIDGIEEALNRGNEAKKNTARINSYTVPSAVIVAVDAGTSATINISSHDRVYPSDGSLSIPTVTIEAGAITGLDYSKTYYVYYDDSTLADTTPTFIATLDQTVAQVGAGPYRHFLGFVTTPASGGSPSDGGGGLPPGGGGGPITPIP